MSASPRVVKDSSDTEEFGPEQPGQRSGGRKNTVPLLIAKHGIHKSSGPNKGQVASKGRRRLAMPSDDFSIGFDPKEYPTGRISRAMLEFSDSDWMSKTLLIHRMVSVIQAIVKGITVRKWFRLSLVEASSRITDRAYFKRLAGIGCSGGTGGAGGDSMDILAQQAHTIRKKRRDGDVTIDLEGVKLLEQRFTRIGKEKAQSGHAYREMTEHVIFTGIPRKRNKSVVLITESTFTPPCVHYNPFSQRYIACPEDRKAAKKVLGALKAPPDTNPRRAADAFLQSPRRERIADTPPQEKHPIPDDLSVSDWTDCDEQEFESLPMKAAPTHHITKEQATEGERQALLHGHYRSRCKFDSTAAQRALEALETRLARTRELHSEAFNPECMDLPANVVQDLLVQKFACNTARLEVPLYRSA